MCPSSRTMEAASQNGDQVPMMACTSDSDAVQESRASQRRCRAVVLVGGAVMSAGALALLGYASVSSYHAKRGVRGVMMADSAWQVATLPPPARLPGPPVLPTVAPYTPTVITVPPYSPPVAPPVAPPV